MVWCNRVFLVVLSSFFSQVSAQPEAIWQHRDAGRYIGELVLKPLDDGRHMRTVKPFGFVDSSGRKWVVPAGAVVDGASIPSFFWSIIGGPFEGKYRNASVIHDYYCDVRTRPWRDTDRVFYEAMRASGVSEREAKVLYMAVVSGGPHWDFQTISNNLLSSSNAIVNASAELHVNPDRGRARGNPTDAEISAEKPELTELAPAKALSLRELIMQSNPTLDQIDSLIEAAAAR
jgi:Protein of unknown function (DUF1353)